MNTGTFRHGRGRVFAIIIIAIVALVVGIFIGALATRYLLAGPSAQSVVDFLASPIPVPKQAKLLKSLGSGGGVGEGFVDWHEELVLDVTGLKPYEIMEVVNAYRDHFLKRFPMQGGGGGAWTRLVKSDLDFSTAMNVEPGWSSRFSDQKNFTFSLDAQWIDVEPNPPEHTMSNRQVVRDLDSAPAFGQRVLWLRLSFQGRGLSGQGIWPKELNPSPSTSSPPATASAPMKSPGVADSSAP